MGALERACTTGAGIGYEYELFVDGIVRTYECRMEPMDDGVICVVQDQTDRVDANRQSLKTAARFRAIVEGSSELVVSPTERVR